MATFATTSYPPAPGCHPYRVADGDVEPVSGTLCTACGLPRWADEHAVTEVFTHDVEVGPGWFCVECSTSRGADWATNGLRWPDIEDARRWGNGLVLRWFGMTDCRIRACDADGEPTGDVLRVLLDHQS